LGRAIDQSTDVAVVLMETPSNPTLTMSDIVAAAERVHAHPRHPILVIDNTLLGPTFQHPLANGADLAVYSATKFLGGFSDLLAGVVLARDPMLIERLAGVRGLLGNILQADESWILDSRLSTVSLRMNRQSKNAQKIAERLVDHRHVKKLIYPSLFTDAEQCRIRDAQTDFPGSLMALEVEGGKAGAFEFLRHLEIARNAVSLGGVESLVCHPRTTTHSELSNEELAEAGIVEGLVRISIGTEHWRDLLDDFTRALDSF
jgi:cystathionine beta-lyase/cystathionine gamma-synthase